MRSAATYDAHMLAAIMNLRGNGHALLAARSVTDNVYSCGEMAPHSTYK